MIGTIYKLTSPSGKSYIGQTIDQKRRKSNFYNTNCYYSGHRLDNAIKKYGVNAFTYEIIIQVIEDSRELLRAKLDELEKYYIEKFDSYKNGYNMTLGGSGTRGCFQTDESRRKLSVKAIGRPSPTKGKPLSDKQKKLLSEYAKSRIGEKNPFYGKKHSDSTKKRIGEANSKPVLQLNVNTGMAIKEFSSAREAARTLGKPKSFTEIGKVCKRYISPSGKHYITALGYKWKFKESSTTIPKGSTLQANGNGNGEPCRNISEDIV